MMTMQCVSAATLSVRLHQGVSYIKIMACFTAIDIHLTFYI